MNLDIPANFLSFMREGSLRIACDGAPSINFTAEGEFRIIDIIDVPAVIARKPGLIRRLSGARDLAGSLRQEGITLEVRLHGEPVLRLGKMASPKLAKIVTLSSDVEIANLRRLKNLGGAFGQGK